jgi:hypothetical protein
MRGRLAQELRIDPPCISAGRLRILLPASPIFLETSTPYNMPGRLQFSAYVETGAHQPRLIYLRNHAHRVTVDRHRPPAAIAADLARRLLHAEALTTARAYMQDERERQNQVGAEALALDTLADAMGSPFIKRQSGYSAEYQARNCRIPEYEIREMTKGHSVTVTLDIANRGALLAILRLARADFELATPTSPA